MGLIKDFSVYLDNWQPRINFDGPELPYGWAGEVIIDLDNQNFMWLKSFREKSDWIENNIDGYEHNVIWVQSGGKMYAQFRKEKDLAWFKLRWC